MRPVPPCGIDRGRAGTSRARGEGEGGEALGFYRNQLHCRFNILTVFWLDYYLWTNMENTFVSTVLFEDIALATDPTTKARFTKLLFEEEVSEGVTLDSNFVFA